jgi:hypothetical protein
MRKRKLMLDREVLSMNNDAANLDGATGWSRFVGCTATCIQSICYGCSIPSVYPLCPSTIYPCPDEII